MNSEQSAVSSQPGPVVSEFQVPRVAILAFYFGVFGVHRFYTRRPILGVLQLLTFGGLGIWALIDLVLILCGWCRDGTGQPITQWGYPSSPSEKRLLPAFLLCAFFGVLGIHRFYVGKIGTGLLQLFTLGGLGLWALIDQFILAWGAFTDDKGHRVSRWT
jgi:TM2 domain-containing membrane protein YozV